MFFRSILLFLFVPSCASVAQDQLVEPCVTDTSTYLDLDFWSFDQDPDLGWRSVYFKPNCALAAADLIAQYHQNLRDLGEPVSVDHPEGKHTISEDGEIPLLYWHEAQIRAFESQTDRAVALMEKSVKPKAVNYGAWNEYALATIAFLERDRDELLRWRAELAENIGKRKINLGVVDGLIACFDKPYQVAYNSWECRQSKAE